MTVTNVVITSVILYFTCILSACAGIGGGGMILPVLITFGGFTYKKCVIFSLCTVFGSHFSQTIINLTKYHPHSSRRPLIYWDLVLILLPAQLGGTTLGVLFSSAFPESLLLVLALCVIVFALYKTYQKGMEIYNVETKEIYGTINDMETVDDKFTMNESLMQSNDVSSSIPLVASNEDDLTLWGRIKIFFIELPRPNYFIVFLLILIWMVYAAFYITLEVAITPCSNLYYIIVGVTLIPLILTILWAVSYVADTQKCGMNLILIGDINFAKLSYMPAFLSFAIGFICSLLGIGTAELSGPLLLSLKMIPLVSSATTSVMSLLYTSSTILHYAMKTPIDYATASIFLFIGLFGGLSGRHLALIIAKKFKRPSIIILALFTVLFVSLILLSYDLSGNAHDFQFSSLC